MGLLTKLLESLAACTATTDSLRASMQSKGMGGTGMIIPSSPCTSTPSPSSVSERNTLVDLDRAPLSSMPTNLAAILEVDPMGPHDKFVSGELSLDGRCQVMYNGFIYDIPHHNPTNEVYLVTRGRRVGIFASW
jgi:hypothetical protein